MGKFEGPGLPIV
nr:hypothetical protein [Tanacetum cinerariifolium]